MFRLKNINIGRQLVSAVTENNYQCVETLLRKWSGTITENVLDYCITIAMKNNSPKMLLILECKKQHKNYVLPTAAPPSDTHYLVVNERNYGTTGKGHSERRRSSVYFFPPQDSALSAQITPLPLPDWSLTLSDESPK